MFKRITAGISRYFQQETLAERQARMLPGAVYSALAMIIFAIVSPVINVVAFPGLHLAVDWSNLVLNVITLGIGAAVVGAIVGWFTEDQEGFIWGGIVVALLILVGNLVASRIAGRGTNLLGQSITVIILPLVIAGVIMALLIRMGIKRHISVRKQADPALRRKQTVQLVAIVCVVGLIPGIFSLLGTSSLSIVHALNQNLQNYATDPLLEQRFPYENLPALKSHFGMDYSLFVRTSSSMTGSIDITIQFTDGYAVTCLVPLTGNTSQLLLNECNEGKNLKVP